jgi:hypothetical protein
MNNSKNTKLSNLSNYSINKCAKILTFAIIFGFTFSSVSAETREELQQELQKLETEIAIHKQAIDTKQKEGKSLERDISILDTKIKKTEAEIKARDKAIKTISLNINDKVAKISEYDKKINLQKSAISQTLSKLNQEDNRNFVLDIASNKSISDVIQNNYKLTDISEGLNDSIQVISDSKKVLQDLKSKLEEDKEEEQAIKTEQLSKKIEIEENKTEKKTILKETKGQEKVYQQILSNTEKRAKEIRSALFSLNNSNETINFGKAYDLAKQVESVTGVRAAFLLGIITVESNLGQNVGKGNWKDDMHPTRDQPIFLEITSELGLDPDQQKVSKRAWYGYGGAMGPAQFIPSTWKMYKDKIASLTGHNPPNPWNPYDAFMAAGLLLKDNGATKGTRAAEHRAAVCYLAGGGNASKASYQFYGNDVMKYADKYEANIEVLKNS